MGGISGARTQTLAPTLKKNQSVQALGVSTGTCHTMDSLVQRHNPY